MEGLVKLVDRAELAANDWSLTPGRYVGVAPEEEDEDFDFAQTLRDIHTELEDLNREAATLAARIKKNFEELGDEKEPTRLWRRSGRLLSSVFERVSLPLIHVGFACPVCHILRHGRTQRKESELARPIFERRQLYL